MADPTQNDNCNACGNNAAEPIVLAFEQKGSRCLNCGLVYCDTKEDLEGLYDSAYDKEDKESFTWNNFLRAHEKLLSGREVQLTWYEKYFLENAHNAQKGKILEIGCSVGRFLLACKKGGWDVHGLDISNEAVELARKVVPDADIRCGKICDRPWPDETFDRIVAYEVIEHMKDPLDSIRTAGKLLKPKGQITISTPDWDSWAIRRHPTRNYWPPFHIWFYNEKSLCMLLKRAGFAIVSIKRNPIPWSETQWPKLKRMLALPWLIWLGIILRQGGGRLVIVAEKE